MKNNKGFSLVELIVVIAIMAILAAVAIPVFGSFITKAEQAADDDLISNINYILNTACLDEGADILDVTSAEWDISTMTLTSVKVNGEENAAIVASFAKLFDINNPKFNTVTSIMFDVAKHKFVDPATVDGVTLSYGGGVINVSKEDLADLKDSTFGEMGMDSLLDQLDDVTDLAAGMTDSGVLSGVTNSQGFIDSAANALGVADAADVGAAISAKKEELAKEALRRAGKTEYINSDTPASHQYNDADLQAAMDKVQANATVLYTAQCTAKTDRDVIQGWIESPNSSVIKANLGNTTNSGTGIAQAALMCGMYTSYVNSGDYSIDTNRKDVNAPNVLWAIDNDANFKTYLTSDQGKADLNGYLASLSIINSSSGDPAAVSELMINGFADPNLKNMMGGLTK